MKPDRIFISCNKEPAGQCRRHKRWHGFNPWIRNIPWRRACNPLQYSCLENPMDRGAWQVTFHRVAESQTWNGTPLQYSCLENPMDGGAWWAAVHGVSKSRTQLSNFTFTFMHWRRKWQPTPVFLPGESQGQGSLVGFRLWCRRVGHSNKSMGLQRVRHDWVTNIHTHIMLPFRVVMLPLVRQCIWEACMRAQCIEGAQKQR